MERNYTPIIDFWFRELTPAQWFAGSPELDDLIRQRFGALVGESRRGALDAWAAVARGRLALILLLDQFSRHVFRGMPDAYAGDAKAQRLSVSGIEAGMDKPLTFAERHFFYMPLMHAEDAALQRLSIRKFAELRDEAQEILGFAEGHCSIVERFGRFPHRNRILGRASTSAEEAYLASEENKFS